MAPEAASSAASNKSDSSARPSPRLQSIDALRGLIMIIMALDHTRDMFHVGAMSFSPTDLTRTTPLLFLTRWITHICLPVFMFTAGVGAFFYGRNRTSRQLSRFLWTRGLWLCLIEVTVMRLAYNFSFSPDFIFLLLILWGFGICMIVMSALIYLPSRWLAALTAAVIALHNCLDGIQAASFGRAAWVWNLLHQPGAFSIAGKQAVAPYPLLPWVAVMAAGFCLGKVFLALANRPEKNRRRILLRIGVALTVAFVVIRAVNLYGDPAPWAHQKSFVFTVLSFLNCTKYPGSLDFLLMTLGPAFLLLALFNQRTFEITNPLIVFGRVPLFYFILHFYLIHALVVLASWLRYGSAAAAFTFTPVPTMGGAANRFPANFGFSLWVVYGVWIVVVVFLYPLCRWFANIKATRRDWWLSYL